MRFTSLGLSLHFVKPATLVVAKRLPWRFGPRLINRLN
jgi:hypothetical protein